MSLETEPGSIELVVDRLHTVHCDAEGRLLRAVFGPSTYRRSFDGRWIEIVSEAIQGERFHVPAQMREPAARTLYAKITQTISDAVASGSEQVGETLGAVLRWTFEVLACDVARFKRAYPRRVAPLPPDQQWAAVVQPDNADHLDEVVAFLGKGLAMRPSVWLDGPCAPPMMLPLLASIQRLGLTNVGAVVADAADVPPQHWRQWGERGLRRLYQPLGSCSAALLATAHSAGLSVAVLADSPLTEDAAVSLAQQVSPLGLAERDTLYVRENEDEARTVEGRLAMRRCFHKLREALGYSRRADAPTVSHFPSLQSLY